MAFSEGRRFVRAVLAAGLLAMGSAAHAAPVPAARPLPPEPDPKPIPGEHVFDLAYSPDRTLLAVVDGDLWGGSRPRKVRSRLTLFDAATHKVIRRLSEPDDVPEPFRRVRFAPDGKSLYLLCFQGPVYTCELPAGVPRKRFDADSGQLDGFALSPDGKQFATTHVEVKVGRPRLGQRRHAMWDASTFKLICDIRSELKLGVCAFTPDGKAVAFGSEPDGGAGVVEFDPRTGAELRRAEFTSRTPEAKPVASPAVYSPDGGWLVLCGGESVPVNKVQSIMRGYLRVWDRTTGAVRELGDGRNDYFRGAALSTDGKRLYGGTRGATEHTDGGRARWNVGEVHCWDTTTWKELWSAETAGGVAEHLAVTPSGRRLWVADRRGLWLLDADTGKPHGGLIETRQD